MSYNLKNVDNAKKMRENGYSLGQIASKIGVSKSTASLWTSKVIITNNGKQKILKRQSNAREKAFLTISRNRNLVKKMINNNAKQCLKKIELTPEICKLLVSIFIWTEGQKWDISTLGFINSDPLMITTFLKLLRKSFNLNESKLRALVHIHEYHNEAEIINYWSKITDIPISQFTKSYLKPHTSIRKKPNYRGCIRINYYDYKVAQELAYLYNTFAQNIRL